MKRAVLSLLVLLAACSEPEVSTVYTVKAYVQADQQQPEVAAVDAVGYVFYGDTTQYRVASLPDALAGKMTGRDGAGARNADMTLWNDQGTLTSQAVTQETVTLVVADAGAQMYAVCIQTTTGGLPALEIPLHFKPYKLLEFETQGRWAIFGEFTTE